MSWDWSCCHIQSLASWYLTVCWSTIIFSISWVLEWLNLYCVMRLEMHWDSACIPSLGCCLTSETSSSLWVQKCFSDFIIVLIASSIMVWLSIRVWRACLSLPSNMSLSCFQPLQLSSAWSGSMSRPSR